MPHRKGSIPAAVAFIQVLGAVAALTQGSGSSSVAPTSGFRAEFLREIDGAQMKFVNLA